MGRVIPTVGSDGKKNGFLILCWNGLEDDYRPEQAYVTAIFPRCHKGPHLHLERAGYFTCLFGDVKIVTREDGEYREQYSGQQSGHETIHVPAGVPAAIYNIGDTTALVQNLPAPAWSRENPDEHPVEDWYYPA